MSDYGIKPDEFETLAKNAKETMRFLFDDEDRYNLNIEDFVAIHATSYK